jgi:hypothetical protein
MKKMLFYMILVVTVSFFIGTANAVITLSVKVDIEPDNKFNYFKYKEEGMHTVAVLGQEDFDAAEMVDPGTITLNRMKVHLIDGEPVFDVRDMNGDGFKDLVVMIDVVGQYYQPGHHTFYLNGKLKAKYGNVAIRGYDKLTIMKKNNNPDYVGWFNMMNGNQRVVYDAMLECYFYPFLNDMVNMTRAEQQEFIDQMNSRKYAGIRDWVFASYEQSDAMKMSLGLMAENLEEYYFGPPGPRTPSSPYLAWTVIPEDYFDVTSIQSLPPIFGDLPVITFNGRIYNGWSIRRDGMSQPPDVGIRLGEADDHFVSSALRTTGINGTITFNHDTHYLPDDATTRDAFPGPLGAWVASVKGPKYFTVKIDVEPDNKFNHFVYKKEGFHTVAILGHEGFNVAEMIDPKSITLDKMKVHLIEGEPLFEVRDMNYDGVKDLVVMIDVDNNYYKPGKRKATLRGKLYEKYGGKVVMGYDRLQVFPKMGDADFVGWYNMTNDGQRLVYDAMLDAWFYPYLNDMVNMTRKDQQKFINNLNKSKYGNICDWVFASYEQSDGMKMSFGLMAEHLEEYSFPGSPPGPRTPSSPYLAWEVVPEDYFDVNSISFLPPIFGNLPLPTFNGRIYSGWSIRRDGMDMSLPPDVAIRLGEADDHFVSSALKTPGINGTITFNHDTHDLPDDATSRVGFPGPFGAWLASVEGPDYLKIAMDILPGDDKNMVKYIVGELMPVALLVSEHFDVANMADPGSITVEKMGVYKKDGEPVYEIGDVNDDGFDDLVVQILIKDIGDKHGITASMRGYLKDNYGCVEIRAKQKMTFVSDGSIAGVSEPECTNYPNPFNPETQINFKIPQDAKVVLKIYNALGQEVRLLTNDTYEAGSHTLRWDGKDAMGLDVASGVYIYRFQADDFVQAKRMLLIR